MPKSKKTKPLVNKLSWMIISVVIASIVGGMGWAFEQIDVREQVDEMENQVVENTSMKEWAMNEQAEIRDHINAVEDKADTNTLHICSINQEFC